MSTEEITFDNDKFREECGLVGIWGISEAANLAYLALYAQQHRGQEGAGVVALDREAFKNQEKTGEFSSHKGLGLVAEVFGGYDFQRLGGRCAIGHVRYTTAGSNSLNNVQPFYAETARGKLALAHNGNLVNADDLRSELIGKGAIFSSNSDTECFLHLIATGDQFNPPVQNLIAAAKRCEGAYSLVVLFEDSLVALRDPHGFRPLAIGKLQDGYVFASETCAFDLIGAQYVRDVKPGEVVQVRGDGSLESYFPFDSNAKLSPCIFEFVYFARPDSIVFERNVYEVRKRMGEELAIESTADADMVVPVPDSGITSALGYSTKSGIPLELGLIRNHYVGRTFIEPKQSIRDFGVKLKLNPNSTIIKNKRIVLIDDSIIRGTTSRKLIMMFKNAGAKEVHLRISAPPTTNPCYYGIDTPDKKELIASRMNVEEITEYLGVDSLAYLSIEGLYRAVHGSNKGCSGYCDACFSGNYPVSIGVSKGKPKGMHFQEANLLVS
jgi:amidophosphoribosyltransferase